MVTTAPIHHRARRRLAAAALTVTAAAGGLLGVAPGASAHPTGCRHAHATITHESDRVIRDAVVCLINHERRAHHLPRLVQNRKLDRSAQRWTNTMISSSVFSHGTAFMNRIAAAGFDWANVGENIATGYGTPAAVVHAWMRSPGHCATILDPVYRQVGTGVSDHLIRHASSRDGTWTQDFGREMGQRALSSNVGPARACWSH